MIRAVLDANVFVSAVLSPQGQPAEVLRAWRAEQFHLVVSAAILEEVAGGRIREHSDRHAGGISQHPGGGGQAQGARNRIVWILARLPQLALRLRKFCQETGQSFNLTVAEALEQYLAQKKKR